MIVPTSYHKVTVRIRGLARVKHLEKRLPHCRALIVYPHAFQMILYSVLNTFKNYMQLICISFLFLPAGVTRRDVEQWKEKCTRFWLYSSWS